jgi:hypothetical protein
MFLYNRFKFTSIYFIIFHFDLSFFGLLFIENIQRRIYPILTLRYIPKAGNSFRNCRQLAITVFFIFAQKNHHEIGPFFKKNKNNTPSIHDLPSNVIITKKISKPLAFPQQSLYNTAMTAHQHTADQWRPRSALPHTY